MVLKKVGLARIFLSLEPLPEFTSNLKKLKPALSAINLVKFREYQRSGSCFMLYRALTLYSGFFLTGLVEVHRGPWARLYCLLKGALEPPRVSGCIAIAISQGLGPTRCLHLEGPESEHFT